MQVFKITSMLSAVCRSEKTRYGFRHLATLQRNGWQDLASAKCCYHNRTWERYTFESVLRELYNNSQFHLSPYEARKFRTTIKNGGKAEAEKFDKHCNTVKAFAQLGALFNDNTKDKNDWQARILKAGLGHLGLTMPEDWDSLTEKEKSTRLDNVLATL